jgi:two-component system chemotaxis sensor kinase CheA
MDDFELEIKKEFLNEALMNLEEVESSFMELESTSDPKPLLDKIFRLAHNLKGGSRAVGFGDVAVFTHKLENLVLKLQKGEVKLGPMVINLLLKSNDRLVEMLMALKQDLNAKFDNSELNTELQNWVDGKIQDNSGGEAPAAEAATSEQISDSTPVESAPEITPEPVADVGVELAVE